MESELDLFHDVLERRVDERTAYVHDRHGDDPKLVRRLLRLLEAHDRAERSGESEPPSRGDIDAVDAIPESIGQYRVLERIGEGGMGVVYAAEQSEPFRRRVAVKVIKLGMDSKEVLARFEAERQAQAMMDHPGVAKALDAGVTSRGRPFFVMELVKGLSLVEYCETNRLGLRDRLQLFSEVCGAVQHAHQKGIVHRDLKPSNILVTTLEGRPVAKVIDFGVAKATASRLSKQTVFTEQGRLIGTPEYMSPEQAEMSSLDVDTRTDVYSLGVILYELLTGALPFDPRTLRQGGYPEILRIIREIDPPLPSARLRELEHGPQGVPGSPELQARMIRGELDWIVVRAMAKDRTRRYGTASALGEDVERYLRDLPVLARRPSVAYGLQKFVKRHRFVTALVALLLLSTVAGITGLAAGLVRAREAEDLAMRRADNAQAAADFLERMLFQADPEYGGGEPTLLEVMERAGQLAESELGPFPEVEAEVRESLGVAYRRRSMFVEAAPHLWRSLEARRRMFGDLHTETARSYIALANLQFEQFGSIPQTLTLLGKAHDSLRSHGLLDTIAEAWLQLDIGFAHLAGDNLTAAAEAFSTCRRLLVIDRGEQHSDISRPLRGLATVALHRGDVPEAERLAGDAVALCRSAEAKYIGARAMLVLARAQMASRKLDAARHTLERVRRQFLETVGQQHIRIAELLAYEARLQLLAGELDAASRSAELCREMRRKLLYEDHWENLEPRLLLARTSLGKGSGALALDEFESLAHESARVLGAEHRCAIDCLEAYAEAATANGDTELQTRLDEELTARRRERALRLDGPR